MDDSGVRRCRIERGTIGEPFMAKSDAWSATGGSFHARRTAARRARAGLMGNARLLAEPAYRRLLAAEPFLRRLIPVLIVVFLAVVALARGLELMDERDAIERQARSRTRSPSTARPKAPARTAGAPSSTTSPPRARCRATTCSSSPTPISPCARRRRPA